MSTAELQSEKLSIVLIGKFNPQIFQPFWFAKHDLVPELEAEKAKVELVHPEISDFSFDWCHFNVASERFILDCQRPERYPPLFDLLISTFTLLSHTPIRALGLNMQYVFRFAKDEEWHAFGHRVAPKEMWKDVLKSPGLVTLQMKGHREDDYAGDRNVTIQSRSPREVALSVNDHFQLDSDPTRLQALVPVLEDQRNISLEKSENIAKILITR